MFLAIVPHYYMLGFLAKKPNHFLQKTFNKNAQKSSCLNTDIL